MKDELVEKIKPYIDAATPRNCPHCGLKIVVLSEQVAHYIKEAILSDPSICEIEVGAELPEIPDIQMRAWRNDYEDHILTALSYQDVWDYIIGRYRKWIKEANWVKKKDGGRK